MESTFEKYLHEEDHDEYYYGEKFPEWVINIAEYLEAVYDPLEKCIPHDPLPMLHAIKKMKLSHLGTEEAAAEYMRHHRENIKHRMHEYLDF